MKRPALGLLLCVVGMACAKETNPAEMNSTFTSSVVDRYAPGLRFGQPITGAERGEATEETDAASSWQSDVKPLPVARDGFTHVRTSGDALAPPRSPAATMTHRIMFFPLRSSGALPSWRNVVAAIDALADRPARPGCALGRLVGIMDTAYVWEQPGGGGAVLLLPPSSELTGSAHTRVARLIVFPRGKRAGDAVEGLEMRPCGTSGDAPAGSAFEPAR